MYDYKANKNDEHSFNKGAVISNVNKQEGGWWRGDYQGRKQLWFPANFVMVSMSNESEWFRLPPYLRQRDKPPPTLRVGVDLTEMSVCV